jgi:hypothetical protein
MLGMGRGSAGPICQIVRLEPARCTRTLPPHPQPSAASCPVHQGARIIARSKWRHDAGRFLS